MPPTSTTTRLLVPGNGKLVLINFDEISWVEAQGNYSIVHVPHQAYRMRSTLRDLAARLPEEQFMRVHRCAVVNLAHIREINTAPGGRHSIMLTTGDEIPLSRGCWKALKQQLVDQDLGAAMPAAS